MKFKFIQTVIKLSLLVSLFCLFIVGIYSGIWNGLGVFAGTFWGCANLWIIKSLVENLLLLKSGTGNEFKMISYLGLKFPVLYYSGYLLLSNDYLSAFYLLVGFILMICILILKSLSNLHFTTQAIRLRTKHHLIIKMALFPIFFVKFCEHMYTYALKISQKICSKIAGFSNQSEFFKKSIVVIFIFMASNLHATQRFDVPEIPNILSLLSKIFNDSPLVAFLYEWESFIFSLLVSIAISLIFYFGTRSKTLVPSGVQNFLEWAVENLRNFIVEVLGPEGLKFVPFLGTLFIFILSMNWLALVPFMKAPTSNLNITVALALCVFFLVQYQNIKNYGLLGFLYHMAGSPKGVLGWAMVPLMLPIELLTQITRPLTLALRLFGNVLGEDILIGFFALFGVLLLSGYSPVGLPMQIPFMFLVLLTGLMQALVFTLLSTIYILLSLPSPEHHSEGN